MCMGNLVQQKVVDKNGNLTTRWVRDYYNRGSGLSDLPAPKPVSSTEQKLPRGAVKEMKEIKARLTEKLQLEHNETNKHGYGHLHNRYIDSLDAVNSAVANREHDKLLVFDKHMSVEFPPEHLSQCVEYLQSRGHEAIPERFTSELMADFSKLSKKLRTQTIGGYPETIKNLSMDERNGLMDHAAELMFLNPGSGEKVYSLIVDHGITNHDQLTAVLEESGRINTPFIGGIL